MLLLGNGFAEHATSPLSRLFLSFVHQNGLKLGSFLFVDISDDCININAMIEK